MTWTDQRPMAFADVDASLAAPPEDEGWELMFELWSHPRPVKESMWSSFDAWSACKSIGGVVVDAQGIGAGAARVSWDALCQVQLEAWLLPDTYLELFVELKARGQRAQASERVPQTDTA